MGKISYILSPKKMRKELEKERRELEEQAAEAAAASKHLPKSFSFYCRSCLYQTNDESGRCPKCGSELQKTR